MITRSGGWLHPSKAFDLKPIDVAMHLGRVQRFGGACKVFWSVLQHSLLAEAVAADRGNTPQIRLLALYHDAHEFITGDVPRPWKTDAVRRQQASIDRKIARAIGLPAFTAGEHKMVKIIDDILCKVEGHLAAPVVVKIKPHYFGPVAEAKKYQELFEEFYAYDDRNMMLEWCWDANGMLVRRFVDLTIKLKGRVARGAD
jgi:hypothetical protein